jgi:hypothetical protein
MGPSMSKWHNSRSMCDGELEGRSGGRGVYVKRHSCAEGDCKNNWRGVPTCRLWRTDSCAEPPSAMRMETAVNSGGPNNS